MRDPDEPLLKRERPTEEDADIPVESRIRSLLERERFAVLCTQDERQPYGSVVALVVDESLRTGVFATGRATRKYRILADCDRVAFVMDDRDRHPDELMSVEAVTATGRAHEVTEDADRARLAELFLSKHPTLRAFVAAPSTALFRVDVVRYLHVWRFQEVRQWIPPNPG
jgi:nitroimidazol reductase NimA-like FMN-containing flavoprotein (pyridoxamine 5'-phosphate oxidase superfamily)